MDKPINPTKQQLDLARNEFLTGVKLSKQGSYARRNPDLLSIPHFQKAKSILLNLEKSDPDNIEILVLLSQIEECLMNYTKAILYLNQSFSAGKSQTKSDLKRLIRLRQESVEWRDLKLSARELEELGSYLSRLNVGPQHTTLDLTKEWLLLNDISHPEDVISALERRGAFSDFQVLKNVVH